MTARTERRPDAGGGHGRASPLRRGVLLTAVVILTSAAGNTLAAAPVPVPTVADSIRQARADTAAFGSHSAAPVTARATTPVVTPRKVVALGDSIPEGDDCPDCTPFPQLLADSLTTSPAVAVPATNLGVGGWTTDDLLTSLTGELSAETSTAIAAADVITVTIGANDFNPGMDAIAAGTCGGPDNLDCEAGVAGQLQNNLGAILDAATALHTGPVTVLVTGYWNVFPDGDVALAQYGPAFLQAGAALTDQANAVIAATALTHHAIYVDLGACLQAAESPAGNITALLADDGDHPSQAGHDAIAATLHTAAVSTPEGKTVIG